MQVAFIKKIFLKEHRFIPPLNPSREIIFLNFIKRENYQITSGTEASNSKQYFLMVGFSSAGETRHELRALAQQKLLARY